LERICRLDSIGRGDAALVGGKAAALAGLLRAGFKVPDGVVLTTSAYTLVIQALRARIDARVTPEVISDPAEIESAAADVRSWLESEEWPPSLDDELKAALSSLEISGPPSYIARTSLPSEELATAFGSGVERAALGLTGLAQVRKGVARGWGALWNSRSMYYRHRKRIPQSAVALAILVQPMVHADAAGVMFTENPGSSSKDDLAIETIWGLGAPLTQARARPDRFLVSKSGPAILDRHVEEKLVRLVLAEDGALRQESVEADRMNAPSLADRQVLALAELGSRIQEFFGGPQDIEWARQGDDLVILQARPIALRAS
jgi:rifampicin phosphotransferase